MRIYLEQAENTHFIEEAQNTHFQRVAWNLRANGIDVLFGSAPQLATMKNSKLSEQLKLTVSSSAFLDYAATRKSFFKQQHEINEEFQRTI